MKFIEETEAQARLDEVLDEAQRQPIVIRREGQDIAAIVSIGDYESIRLAGVTSFIQARNDADGDLREAAGKLDAVAVR